MRAMSRRLAAGLITSVVLVAGCSNSGDSSETTAGPAMGQTQESRADSAGSAPDAAGGKGPEAAGTTGTAAQVDSPAALGRQIVRSGTLTVQTADVPGTITRVLAAVRGARGYVESQQADINPNDHRQDNAKLTLKVPGSTYDTALPALSRLGTLLSSEDRRDDVTGDVIDVSSRLATEKASVARVRTLLSRARTIGEVVAVESELTKREASLESLEARLAGLKGQVSYGTITMALLTPTAAGQPTKPTQAGFLSGLRAGWHSFAAVVVGVLTAIGAALPFAVTLLLLAGLALALRRRLVRRPPAPATE